MKTAYNVIGFSLDNCIVKYKEKALVKLLVQTHLHDLYERCEQYPEEVKQFDYEKNLGLYLNCAVWDINNGTVLKLSDGQRVEHAIKGYNKLS